MRNSSHVREAASQVSMGKPLAIFAIQYGIVFTAEQESTAHNILKQVKGPHRVSPLPIWIDHPDEILAEGIVDLERIHPDLRSAFQDSQELAFRTQGICMVRLPVKPGSELHGLPLHRFILDSSEEDGAWLQFFYMGDNQLPTQRLIEEIKQAGTKIVAISSLNLHGKETPMNHREAAQFCQEQGITTFISDNHSRFTDRSHSYPIIKAGLEGAVLVRKGNVHPDYLRALWGKLSYAEGVSPPQMNLPERHLALFQRVLWTEFPQLANLVMRMEHGSDDGSSVSQDSR